MFVTFELIIMIAKRNLSNLILLNLDTKISALIILVKKTKPPVNWQQTVTNQPKSQAQGWALGIVIHEMIISLINGRNKMGNWAEITLLITAP